MTSLGTPPDGSLDQRFGARWLADLGVAYRWRRLELRLGADNLFNTYPDRNRVGDTAVEGNSTYGMFPYSSISPFGFNGRFVYLGMSRQW